MARRSTRDIFGQVGPEQCVIYLRISQDREGSQLGIERQESECRALAAERGLIVVRVYTDNDISATSGKVRPDFEAMLAARPEAIISWHQDRLLRLSSDLEKVIDLEVPVYFVTSGSLDLSTPAGRAVARTIAAWSQYEIEQKSIRQEASNRQRAERGVWQFSSRPYGYKHEHEDENGKGYGPPMIVEDEAEVIREGYRRVITGESYRAVAMDWNARGIKPVKGEKWLPARVQRLLENHHYAGIVSYRGEEFPDAKPQWSPIISRREWADFRELKLNRKQKRSWAVTPKYLLSGMLICGVCKGSVFVHTRYKRTEGPTETSSDGTTRRTRVSDRSRPKEIYYTCFDNHCVSVTAEPVEAFIENIVLKRLADRKIIRALKEAPDTTPVEEEIADLQRRRDDITSLYLDRLITSQDARQRLENVAERLERAQAHLTSIRRGSSLTDLALSKSIPARWREMSMLDKRHVIADLGMKLTLAPALKGSARRNDDGQALSAELLAAKRIEIEWLNAWG